MVDEVADDKVVDDADADDDDDDDADDDDADDDDADADDEANSLVHASNGICPSTVTILTRITLSAARIDCVLLAAAASIPLVPVAAQVPVPAIVPVAVAVPEEEVELVRDDWRDDDDGVR
jgi:hypothetical protein